jgi:hypothetical protein
MAWRIDEFLVRGEIDNHVRGRVTGRLWFAGRADPVELDLDGNAWRDVAGRLLVFVNPAPKAGMQDGLRGTQTGVVGDITASRKVKVPEIPLDQIGEYCAARRPWPWHWGNSLYLEWFSIANGRVVIESAGYGLSAVGEAAWEMTEEEERNQRQANGEALGRFMERLDKAAAAAAEREDAAQEDDRPQTEQEAERMLEESDRLGDRIEARMEREGSDADYEKILDEELEKRRRERGEPPLTPDDAARSAEWIEELNRAAEEAASAPGELEKADRKHPLAERAFEFSVRLHKEVEDRGWLTANASPEHPVAELVASAMKAAAKLAGALNGEDYPPLVDNCGHVIARLKRAAGYLNDAQLAVEACEEQELTESAWLAEVRREIGALAAETDRIIAELRERLARGWD